MVKTIKIGKNIHLHRNLLVNNCMGQLERKIQVDTLNEIHKKLLKNYSSHRFYSGRFEDLGLHSQHTSIDRKGNIVEKLLFE